MPNWCSTEIKIRHDDKKKLEELYDKIVEWTSKDYSENGFGNNWLGNVVGHSGIAKWDDNKNGMLTKNEQYISCRGQITSLDMDEEITIWQEDAWGPNVLLWVKVLAKYLPDASLEYTATEPGCGVYTTNDPNLEGCYMVDIFDNPEGFEGLESIYEADEDDVIDICQEILKTKKNDINELIKETNNLDWVHIAPWEQCDPVECN